MLLRAERNVCSITRKSGRLATRPSSIWERIEMVEILCTVAGMIAGVAIVGSLLRDNASRGKFRAVASEAEPGRIKEIANQLRLISAHVAANVSAHSDKVEHFNEQLGDLDSESDDVYSAIDEIIEANKTMQAELASAQQRIATQSEMIEQASQQARTDALTGLANRRALDEYLANIIEYTQDDDVVGLLLLDIDHFKNFNDSFGHTTGDAVLASFARSITKSCGADGYAARYGGEEFAVVLTAGSETKLVEKSAEIRRYVSEQVIAYDDLQLRITASAGLSRLCPDDSITSVYERADVGLYKAKEAGRNCGYWLCDEDWRPFPACAVPPVDEASRETPPRPKSRIGESTPLGPDDKTVESEIDEPLESSESELTSKADQDDELAAAEMDDANEDDCRAELLDLTTFLEGLEGNLEQLRRAEMPGTGMMVEAINVQADGQELIANWDQVVQLIQLNLRSEDLVCQYRLNTLCVFMSGCSQNVSLDRASLIQASLLDAKKTRRLTECPDRFAIAVATVHDHEQCSQFLNRLEAALDDAQDADASQAVVHDGESMICQQI
jgi:diguanylate cyclase